MALQWFHSYFSDRQQFVYFGNEEFIVEILLAGYPKAQSGVRCYLLYIQMICHIRWKSLYRYRLPMILPYMLHPCLSELIPLINEDLHLLAEWFAANKLALNEQKYKYIIFSKRTHVDYVMITISGIPITRSHTTNFWE